jgi:hypothetical protein
MTLATVAWVYTAGWFLYSAWFVVGMYRRGDVQDMESKILSKIENDPEAAEHYVRNVHGIRTKMRLLLPALPLLFGFMFGSVWPLALAIRVAIEISSLGKRD